MIRKCLLLGLTYCLLFQATAQIKLPEYNDSLFSTYYWQRVKLFELMPLQHEDIVLVGNSITDGAEWNELFHNLHVKNRGISGDITAGVLHRWASIVAAKPRAIFLMIGTNDLARGIGTDSVIKNILLAADYLQQESPRTRLFIQSILPVTDYYKKFGGHTSKAAQIKEVNSFLKVAAAKHRYTFVDLHAEFIDAAGKMQLHLTNDGLHLTGEGYLLWKHLIYPHVYQYESKPALIPQPRQVNWTSERFPLYKTSTLVVKNKQLASESAMIVAYANKMGLNWQQKEQAPLDEPYIELLLGAVSTAQNQEEGYELQVSHKKIIVKGATPHGVFNGLQTLKQLMRDGSMVDGCAIIDWPAFSMRGYMIDVGRNYMSVDLLKQQIDIMAANKMNVFHFHPTEDIAWRFEIKAFPQLTEARHMLRNKGKYYTTEEIRELSAYCKERHITFIPEIDMPGHSAAFRRAMGFDMQSDSGKLVLRKILQEICDTYDFAYIHIGSDEVRIKDTGFIPEMTRFLQARGKKVLGWKPGGNFNASTIRQLWREDAKRTFFEEGVPFIDSRHLYLNHHDPLESVTTIFNRKISNRERGDSFALGAILCLWHDRNVGRDDDVLKMNPVYPGMLTFAERSWRGGGRMGWVANVSDGDQKSLEEFEKRLVEHQQLYFKDRFFPYQRHTQLEWSLFGPFPNGGDLEKNFDIEEAKSGDLLIPAAAKVKGGTIVLRHFWDPLIKGAIAGAQENTTWYAETNIWSEVAGLFPFWIGFMDLSRSPATNTPPAGKWDTKGSRLWVNGQLIEPPHWSRAGAVGEAEVPLIDEGYSYRSPSLIKLQRGWNKVLIKAPVGSFKGIDGQNPVKWMFTFVAVR